MIVYGIVQKYGIDGLTVATLMAGVLLVVMGLAKLGSAIKFIPHPVIIGFTSGIAVIIFSSQIKDLFGLKMGAVPAEFLGKWIAFIEHARAFTPTAIGVGAVVARDHRGLAKDLATHSRAVRSAGRHHRRGPRDGACRWRRSVRGSAS